MKKNIELLHGDCLELMKKIPDKSIDMILCDLPYGTTACKWDVVIHFEPLWKQYNRIIKDNGAIVLFGTEPFSSKLRISNIKHYKYDLYWVKQKPVNFLQLKRRFGKTTETISIFYKKQPTYNPQKIRVSDTVRIRKTHSPGTVSASITAAMGNFVPFQEYRDDGTRYPTDILRYNRVNEGDTIHPAQKPVKLLEMLVRTFTNEGDIVLDNCMGSGSTGVACIKTKRKFIGMELDKHYFDVAVNRIAAGGNNE